MNGTLAERHTSLFVSFTVTHNKPCQKIDIVLFQSNELRDAQARGVHDLEHRTIAYPFFRRYIGRSKQAIDLVFREKLRQVTKALWCIEVFGRMRLDVTVEHEKFKKSARCADRASNRCWCQTFPRKTRDPFAQVGTRQLRNVFPVFIGPGLKSIEIASIGLAGVTREVCLDLQVG